MEFNDVVTITNSSVFNEIAYDEKNYYLRVRLKTGVEYIYDNVPLNIWQGFKTAESKGRYYASNIRGKYKTQDTRIADTSVPR